MSAEATPVGGKLMTSTMKGLLILVGIAAVLLLWRFAAGLGAVTNLSDGYPWGLWIAFDVVTGTALGCGGYAVALLVYAFNKGKYHPLVRSALLASALYYLLGGATDVVIASQLQEMNDDMPPEQMGELFEPAADKVYRHPTFYDVPDEVKHM